MPFQDWSDAWAKFQSLPDLSSNIRSKFNRILAAAEKADDRICWRWLDSSDTETVINTILQEVGDKAGTANRGGRAGPSNAGGPSNNIADFIAAGQHLTFNQGLPAFSKEQASGDILQLPDHPLLQLTINRQMWMMKNGMVPVMHRSVTKTLENFIMKKSSLAPLVLTGPKGHGKSYSLLEVVCILAANGKNRVIYIPDCGGWASQVSKGAACNWLLKAICCAFSADEAVLERCKQVCLSDDASFEALLQWLPSFCEDQGLALYAIFDGHNGIPATKRPDFPFNIPVALLNSSPSWKPAKIIIAGSSNNEYRLDEDRDSSWPRFEYNKALTTEEAQVYLRELEVWDLVEPYFAQLLNLTGAIPLELREFATALTEFATAQLPKPEFEAVRLDFEVSKKAFYFKQCGKFTRDFVKEDPAKQRAASRAVLFMHLGLSISPSDYVLPDLQLMHWAWAKVDASGAWVPVESSTAGNFRILLPTTPLAARVLASFYEVTETSRFKTVIHDTFVSLDRTVGEKGLSLQRYFDTQVRERKELMLSGWVVQGVPRRRPANFDWASFRKPVEFIAPSGLQVVDIPPACIVPPNFDRLDLTKKTIFLTPEGYIGVDFLLWDPECKRLLCINISLQPLASKAREWTFDTKAALALPSTPADPSSTKAKRDSTQSELGSVTLAGTDGGSPSAATSAEAELSIPTRAETAPGTQAPASAQPPMSPAEMWKAKLAAKLGHDHFELLGGFLAWEADVTHLCNDKAIFLVRDLSTSVFPEVQSIRKPAVAISPSSSSSMSSDNDEVPQQAAGASNNSNSTRRTTTKPPNMGKQRPAVGTSALPPNIMPPTGALGRSSSKLKASCSSSAILRSPPPRAWNPTPRTQHPALVCKFSFCG